MLPKTPKIDMVSFWAVLITAVRHIDKQPSGAVINTAQNTQYRNGEFLAVLITAPDTQ